MRSLFLDQSFAFKLSWQTVLPHRWRFQETIMIFSVVLMKKWITKTDIDVSEVEDESDENDKSGSEGEGG